MAGFWIALAALLIATAGGIAFAVYRGICLYKRAKRTGAAFEEPLERIEAATASIDRHLAAAESSSVRLSTSTERLRVSRARLDVQLAAVADARARVRRMFWFVPGI